ncbi:MAG: GNAT family N-acetyltransferase [Clostridia bacterium]
MTAVTPAELAAIRRPGGTGTRVEIIDKQEALRALIPEWEALAAESAEPNPFYEHWMLLPALDAFGGEGFRMAAVWEDGKLGALFALQHERRWRGLPVRALRSWRHRNMLIATPLISARGGAPGAAKRLGALLDCRIAPLIEFEWTAAGGTFHAALAEAAAHRGLPCMATNAYARPILVRGRDPRPRYNSNMKNNLRRWEARLRAAGELAPTRLEPGCDFDRWVEEFMRLEASGWKGKAGTALACREDDRRFAAAVLPEAFRRGQLVGSGLDLSGRPLSRHLAFASGEGAFTFKLAYDETHASSSPGTLGEVENVRQFLAGPGPDWLDSNTAAENAPGYARAWKDWRTVQRLAVGITGAGCAAVAALPMVRLVKKALKGGGSRGRKGS